MGNSYSIYRFSYHIFDSTVLPINCQNILYNNIVDIIVVNTCYIIILDISYKNDEYTMICTTFILAKEIL